MEGVMVMRVVSAGARSRCKVRWERREGREEERARARSNDQQIIVVTMMRESVRERCGGLRNDERIVRPSHSALSADRVRSGGVAHSKARLAAVVVSGTHSPQPHRRWQFMRLPLALCALCESRSPLTDFGRLLWASSPRLAHRSSQHVTSAVVQRRRPQGAVSLITSSHSLSVHSPLTSSLPHCINPSRKRLRLTKAHSAQLSSHHTFL